MSDSSDDMKAYSEFCEGLVLKEAIVTRQSLAKVLGKMKNIPRGLIVERPNQAMNQIYDHLCKGLDI